MVANRAMRKLLERELAPHEQKMELYADTLTYLRGVDLVAAEKRENL